MAEIAKLEMHVAHSCNLACESCSHFSNQGHKGLVSFAEAEEWISRWASRVTPSEFSLLGGEPAIHPQLSAFLALVRRYWPAARIRIVSNGFLLSRHPDLPHAMVEAGNARLYISIHHNSAEYAERLRPTMDMLEGWRRDYGVDVRTYKSASNWTRRYHGIGAAMQPFADGKPQESWAICPARFCMQLFEGALWKCSPLAYLRIQHAKYSLGEAWSPYLAYEPLRSDCSDAELQEFISRKAESTCGMCPSVPHRFELPMPILAPMRAAGSNRTDRPVLNAIAS